MNNKELEVLKQRLAAVKPSLTVPFGKPQPTQPKPTMARIMQSWTVQDWREAKK
jgi:hypothetical protein